MAGSALRRLMAEYKRKFFRLIFANIPFETRLQSQVNIFFRADEKPSGRNYRRPHQRGELFRMGSPNNVIYMAFNI
jgi:hypothetical protein